MALAECGTHALLAAEVDGYQVGEKTLAQRLYPRLRSDELLTADRGSYSWQAWDIASATGAFFDLAVPSPFMLDTATVREPATLPAITHVDHSARMQTVDRRDSPRFHALLSAFGRRTGYPILLNTSFNMRGEPIVATPADALACFVRSRLDVLVLGDVTLHAQDVPDHWFTLVDQQLPYRQPVISRDVYSFL